MKVSKLTKTSLLLLVILSLAFVFINPAIADSWMIDRLTDDVREELSPVWSPDATKIAYISRPIGEGIGELHVIDLTTGSVDIIYDYVQYYKGLHWVGDYIAFVKFEKLSKPHAPGDNEVWKIKEDGTGLQQITFTYTNGIDRHIWGDDGAGTVGIFALSPDGNKLAFVAQHGNGWYDPYVCNADGSDGYVLLQNLPHCFYIKWNADGSKVYYAAGSDHYPPQTMYRSNPDGSGDETITGNLPQMNDFVFSPDGSTVAMITGIFHRPCKSCSVDQIDRNLTIMNPDGTGRTDLLNDSFDDAFGRVCTLTNYDPGYAYRPSFHVWAPDNDTIVFTSNRSGNFDIWTIKKDGTGLTQITTDSAPDYDAGFSPDVSKIVFISERDGQRDLYLMVPEPPSGGKLLVRSHNGSDWDLHLIGEDGSHLQAIDTTSANIEFRGASFSPDGKNILYLRSSGSTYEIMHTPVTGGPPSLVLGNTGLPFPIAVRWGSSPDHFFYTIQTGGSCGNRDWVTRRRALDGSFDEIIISAISEKDLYLFDIREDLNRSVYGQNIPAGCWSPYGALVTYDADGTNRQVLSVTVDGKCDSSAALSPDGEYVLYGKSDSASGWQLPNNIYLTTYIDSGTQTRLTSYTGNICAHAPVWRDDDSFFYSMTPTDNPQDELLHYYKISTGEDVVVPCDLPNCQPLDFMMTPEAPTIPATIEIIPNTLNLKSKGRWITCYIWLPEGYDVSDISNILLEDNIEPRQMWSDEKKQVMKTRFGRKEVQDILTTGEIELTITVHLTDGTVFEARDVIRVIDKGRRN